MKNNKMLTINGMEAIITYKNSKSKQKDNANIFNLKTVELLRLLLKENNQRIESNKGIKTCKPYTTRELLQLLNVTRPSNIVVELRKVTSHILTFRYIDEKEDRYALIDNKEIRNYINNIIQLIEAKLSNK